MKIFVAHASNFDFDSKLYIPLRNSDLNSKHTILLPQENGKKENITKEIIKSCNAIIAEMSRPSTGQGIELGWADIYNIPIICICERGSKISSSVNYVTNIILEYSNSEDMIEKIGRELNKIK